MTRLIALARILPLAAMLTATVGAAPAPASTLAVDGVTLSAPQWVYYKRFTDPARVSPPITATPVGGTAPYSYRWEKTGGDSLMAATAPSSATTGFRRSLPHNVTTVVTAYFRAVVSDSTGSVAYSAAIPVTFEYENGD